MVTAHLNSKYTTVKKTVIILPSVITMVETGNRPNVLVAVLIVYARRRKSDWNGSKVSGLVLHSDLSAFGQKKNGFLDYFQNVLKLTSNKVIE